eukprot:s2466_g9.t1
MALGWVVAASVLSSLGAFLFGLDIGYIAPILECESFKHDVAKLENWWDPQSKIHSETAGFIVGVFSIGCICVSFPPVSSYFLDAWGRTPEKHEGRLLSVDLFGVKGGTEFWSFQAFNTHVLLLLTLCAFF